METPASAPSTAPTVTFPLAGQMPTRLVLDNQETPLTSVATTNNPLNPLLTPIWTPEPGTFGIIRSAKIVFTSGSSPLERGSSLYARPTFPTSGGHGDGPYLAAARMVPANSVTTGYGGYGPAPAGEHLRWTEWNSPMLLTPSYPLSVLSSQVVGDSVYWVIEVDVYKMVDGQAEVVFDGISTPLPGTGSEGKTELGGPEPGFAWIPVGAEANVSTGPEAGTREGNVFYGGHGDDELGTLLATTGPLDVPDVQNNNATGSYAPNGSAPGDGKNHIEFPANAVVVGKQVFAHFTALIGDSTHYAAVFINTPATVPP